jgi:hypothetical protein
MISGKRKEFGLLSFSQAQVTNNQTRHISQTVVATIADGCDSPGVLSCPMHLT